MNKKDVSIGSWITIGHPSIADIMADAGFDWLCIDMEHTVIDYTQAQNLISAIQGKGRPLMSSAAVKRIKKKIPERLAEVRGDRSQRQFARELGVFQQNINRYENGTTPHTDFLITLSIKENISIDWLLFGKGRMRKGR